jgi:hypothetical protein
MPVYVHGREHRSGSLFWGVALIVVGAAVLMHQLGVLPWSAWLISWPVVVIALGLARGVTARRPRQVGEGVTWVLLGAWFVIATNRWHGLDWRHSWPLALIAVGFGEIARAIASRFMRRDDGVEVRVGQGPDETVDVDVQS